MQKIHFEKKKSRTQNLKIHSGEEFSEFKNVFWKCKSGTQNLKMHSKKKKIEIQKCVSKIKI